MLPGRHASESQNRGITNLPDGMAAAKRAPTRWGSFSMSKPPPHLYGAAAGIIRSLPPFVMKVGVFVNAPEELVLRASRECGLNLLQFHGDEPPEYCLQFGLMSMKAFRIRDAASLQAVRTTPRTPGCLMPIPPANRAAPARRLIGTSPWKHEAGAARFFWQAG